jgi:hypothetical protein
MNYMCKKCNKDYKSYQSIWNHNKKFHVNNCQPLSNNCQPQPTKYKIIICENCNKQFNTRQAKSVHKKNVK